MNRKVLWFIGVLILLIGCGGGEEVVVEETAVSPTSIPEPTAIPPTVTAVVEEVADSPAEESAVDVIEETAVPDPTPTIPPAQLGGTLTTTVTITASDGLPLHATYYAPVSSSLRPAVILLHMLGSNREAWLPTGLPQELVKNGRYHVLALDMRGHGETGGERDWSLAEEELQLVWQWLVEQPGVDGERTAVVGASIGSNMALRTGANIETINTVVLLSPGLDYFGVTTEDALAVWGKRPLLIVASEEDSYAADSSRTLAEQAQGEVELLMYQSAGHGTTMFNAEPALVVKIAEWLATYWE